jgi:hypothetical protein
MQLLLNICVSGENASAAGFALRCFLNIYPVYLAGADFFRSKKVNLNG